MKKIMLVAMVAGTFVFTSCSKDDDESSNCKTCESSFDDSTVEVCDNGDGTYTVTEEDGTESTDDIPEGMTFNQYITMLVESGTADCN